jgi:GH43 family beta-xylosidase
MSHALSRRTLLLGTLGVGGLFALTEAGTAQASGPRTDAEIYGVPTTQPLISQRADPFITPRIAGMYYFTGSVPEYDRIAVRGATTLGGLTGATETVIWHRPPTGKMGGHIWAPELHRIDGRWYVYFAAGDSDDVFRIRTYVLESSLADPLDPAGWTLKGQLLTEWDGFTLDSTTFAHRGRRYLAWAESEPEIAVNSSIYIARLANPWTLASKPTRITTPTRSWEIQGYRVNEGPAVLIRNGRVFLTFSASATDARYCMGLLTASADADLLDRASWVKTPDPIFVTSPATARYGPGHNSFTVAEDGVTDVLVYHARDYRDITGDPLYDPNRHTRVQKLYWHPDGTPLFGVPVGDGGPIVRLSRGGHDFVRHDDAGLLMVAHAPRDLAATQFRFESHDAGTEVIRSVDHPDRFVRIDGPSLRLDATPTPFRRNWNRHGVTIQADGGGYLHADHTTLTIEPKPTTFELT